MRSALMCILSPTLDYLSIFNHSNKTLCLRCIRSILLLCLLLAPLSALSKNLSMGIGEFLPYVSATYEEGGPITQIVKQSFAKVNQDVSFYYRPWNRTYTMARELKFDATFPWSPNEQRSKDFYFSDPLYHFQRRGFVLSHSSLDILNDVKIQLCHPIGYGRLGYEKKLLDSQRAVLIEPPDMHQCFVMLKAGRVDLVVVEMQESRAYIDRVFDDASMVRPLEKVFHDYQNHLLVSKKHPQVKEILKQFNIGLKRLKESGDYDRIIQASLIESPKVDGY